MCTALSCSVNLLLDDVLVTVVIVVCSSSVHTYPDIFESASFFFLETASVHTHPVISAANTDILKCALQGGKKNPQRVREHLDG